MLDKAEPPFVTATPLDRYAMWFGLRDGWLYITLKETGVMNGPPLEKRSDMRRRNPL